MSRNLVVITAGLSEPSSTRLLADLLADASTEAFGELARPEVRVVELRPLAHAITDAMLTGFAGGELADVQSAVARADGLIVVTPVFSASYSGLFKSFFDVLEEGSLEGTPVLIAATAGTARHSLVLEHALRPLFSYLHAVVVPTGVFAAAEDWASGGVGGALRTRIDRAAAQFAALVTASPAPARHGEFDDVPDFAALLAR